MRFSSTVAALTLGAAMLLSPRAGAYRPFDQTDAAVAEYRDVELELGPVALARSSAELVVVAPSLVINYGILPGAELVLEGKNERTLRPSLDTRWRPQDLAVSIKALVRRGSLQGADGLSIALEPTALLPGRDQSGVGGQVGVILSLLGPVGALHFNVVPGVSRAHAAAGSIGVIAEGPYGWRIRPVGESLAYGEAGDGRLVSVLFGFIARAGEALTFDGAILAERAAGRTILEVRAGLTWTFGS
jgi:hypothetical protein